MWSVPRESLTEVALPLRRVRQETFTSAGLLLLALALAFSASSWPARAAGALLVLYALLAVAWRAAGRDVLLAEGDELVLRRELGPLRREAARVPHAQAVVRERQDSSSGAFLMRPSDLGFGLGWLELDAGGRAHRFGETSPERVRALVRPVRATGD